MGEKKTNKTGWCCGCIGVGCFSVVAAVILLAYFGFGYFSNKGRKMASAGFYDTTAIMLENAFNEEQKQELMSKVKQISNDIKSGKISLIRLGKRLSNVYLTQSLLSQTMALSMKTVYLTPPAEKNDSTEKLYNERSNILKRFIYGVVNKKIDKSGVNGLFNMVKEPVAKKVVYDKNGDSFTVHAYKLNLSMSDKELKEVFDYLKNLCKKVDIPEDLKSFNEYDSVKQSLLNFFESFYESKHSVTSQGNR